MVKKKTETRVTTETIDLYVCPSCQQGYEPEEMINIGLGAAKSEGESVASFEEITMLCRNCAESIFEYEGDAGSVPQKEIELDSRNKPNPNVGYKWAMLLWFGIITHFLGWVLGVAYVESPVFDWAFALILLSWGIIPVALYLDIRHIEHHSEWKPHKIPLAMGSVFWFLNIGVGLYYLVDRHKNI